MDFEAKVQFSDMLFAQEIDGEIVLLDMRTEHYFGLDSVAAAIWKQLQEGKTIRVACETLLQTYDVEADRLHADVETFIASLIDAKLAALV